jgi:hypothetical protein
MAILPGCAQRSPSVSDGSRAVPYLELVFEQNGAALIDY